MKEYDIYLPALQGDDEPVASETVDRIKETVVNAFGGYTHLTQRCEGSWTIGGVEFRESVTILRALDGDASGFDMQSFKRSLETVLKQDRILIVVREVTAIP